MAAGALVASEACRETLGVPNALVVTLVEVPMAGALCLSGTALLTNYRDWSLRLSAFYAGLHLDVPLDAQPAQLQATFERQRRSTRRLGYGLVGFAVVLATIWIGQLALMAVGRG